MEEVCRYCLDPETERNYYISPCICSGSVGQVHIRCFKHWYRIQVLSAQPLTCPICKTGYKKEYSPALEMAPSRRTLTVFFLSNPPLLSLFAYYGYICFANRIHSTDPYLVQGVIHATYFILFLRSARVRNPLLYVRAAGYRYCIVLMFHWYLWIYILERNVLCGFAADFLLSLYWNIHMSTLEKINDYLLTP